MQSVAVSTGLTMLLWLPSLCYLVQVHALCLIGACVRLSQPKIVALIKPQQTLFVELAPDVQDTVDSVTGKGKNAASDAYDAAKDTLNSGAQYAQDAATTGKYKAQQAAGDASQYASDTANSAQDSASQFAGHATGKQGFFDKVKNKVTGQSNDAAAAGDQANYYARTGSDSAAQYAAAANDKAGSAAGDAAQYAKDSVNQANDAAGQFVGHASNTAQGKQGGIWDKVKNAVSGHSNDAANSGEAVGNAAYNAKNSVGQTAQDAKAAADQASGKASAYAQVCATTLLLLCHSVHTTRGDHVSSCSCIAFMFIWHLIEAPD